MGVRREKARGYTKGVVSGGGAKISKDGNGESTTQRGEKERGRKRKKTRALTCTATHHTQQKT